MRASLNGDYVAPSKDAFDLKTGALFGGITGFALPMPSFEVMPGLTLEKTYTHLSASFILAFSPPAKPTAPHPGPWAALDGMGLDILVEARLDVPAFEIGFDRLNTLWFLVALLRIRLALPIQMIAIADRPFQNVPQSTETANIIPVELNLSHLPTASPRPPSEADLVWVRDNIESAAKLMKEASFNRAVQTLDQAIKVLSPGAAIVIAWAAIETLIRPGSRQITSRLCRALAAYLNPPGPQRDRAYNEITSCYAARGGAVHAANLPEPDEFRAALELARAAVIRCIQDGQLPDVDELLHRWESRT